MTTSDKNRPATAPVKWQFCFYNWQAHVDAEWPSAFETPNAAKWKAAKAGGWSDDFFVFPVRELTRKDAGGKTETYYVPVENLGDNAEHFQIKKGDYRGSIHAHEALLCRLSPVRRLKCRCAEPA